MAKSQKKPRVIQVSNAEVAKFRKYPQLPGDRRHKEQNDFEIESDLLRHVDDNIGLHSIKWALVFCRQTGVMYRVNGNHTSKKLSEVDLREFNPIWIVVDMFECDTLDEAYEIYLTYDKRTGSKSARDHNRAIQPSSELREIPPTHYDKFVPAIVLATKGSLTYRNETLAERAKYILSDPSYIAYCKWYSNLVTTAKQGGLGKSVLLRVPGMAAVYKHWAQNRSECKRFWQDVKCGETKQTSPQRKLHELLKKSELATSTAKLHKDGPIKLTSRVIPLNYNSTINACDQAWEAYRQGKNRLTLKYDESPFKIV